MKFLLTSAGIKNTSIHNALVGLLGKPIAESSALCIPTACTPYLAVLATHGGSLADKPPHHVRAGWKSLGVLELTALPASRKSFGFPCSGD